MTKEQKAEALAAKIAAETPHSITATDSPIFRATRDLNCLVEEGHLVDNAVLIPAGTLLRILDCDLDSSGFTMIRYNPTPDEELNISIMNEYLEYVSGNLGVRVEEEEE
jgi:hypothetical protein